MEFDAAKFWTILAPRSPLLADGPAAAAAAELAHWLGRLRGAVRSPLGVPPILDAAGPAPDDSQPIIALNLNDDSSAADGYSWRAAAERIEIWGDSAKGLLNGVYDFLDALGWRWLAPGDVRLVSAGVAGPLTLARSGAFRPAPPGPRGLALFMPVYRRFGPAWLEWAARNRLNALFLRAEIGGVVFDAPLDRVLHRRQNLAAAAAHWGVNLEMGGHCLSTLLPRRLFFGHKDLFRMSAGRRSADRNFCPTNPDTIAVIREQARQRFRAFPGIAVFHLWPDPVDAAGNGWCACPACRAFSPTEQELIALNAVADALSDIAPQAQLSLPPDWPAASAAVDDQEKKSALRARDNLRPYGDYPCADWPGATPASGRAPAAACRAAWIASRSAWLEPTDTRLPGVDREARAAAEWERTAAAHQV